METPAFMLLCALIVVFASTGITSLIKVAALFKRSQLQQAKDAHDRAEARELGWYYSSDRDKKARELRHRGR
jgi:hypothetical protein